MYFKLFEFSSSNIWLEFEDNLRTVSSLILPSILKIWIQILNKKKPNPPPPPCLPHSPASPPQSAAVSTSEAAADHRNKWNSIRRQLPIRRFLIGPFVSPREPWPAVVAAFVWWTSVGRNSTRRSSTSSLPFSLRILIVSTSSPSPRWVFCVLSLYPNLWSRRTLNLKLGDLF